MESLLPQLTEIVRHTGDWMRTERRQFSRTRTEHKGRNDLVSYVDRTAEAQLTEALGKLLPGSGFINEEGGTHIRGHQNWIIDPLDGTTNYIHGIPVYAVSVALMDSGKIVLGCVYDPEHGEMFTAEAGKGAFLNGEIIQVSDTLSLDQSLVATGFPYTIFEHIDNYMDSLKAVLQATRGIRRPGAASVDLVWTACGRFDAFYESRLHPWDVAAGALIVQEAGGRVSTFGGSDDFIFGKEIIATNGQIHEELSAILRRFPIL